MKRREKHPDSSTNKREKKLKFGLLGTSFDKLNDPGALKHSAEVQAVCNQESVASSMLAFAFDLETFLSKNDSPSKSDPSCTELKMPNLETFGLIGTKDETALFTQDDNRAMKYHITN
jgi:hypothetical protein